MHWEDKVTSIKGIGNKTADILAKMGILSVGELVSYYPRDYDSYKQITSIASVREGMDVVIEGTLTGRPTITRIRNLTLVNATIKDSTGSIRVTWFNMPYITKTVKVGTYYIMRGKVGVIRGNIVIEQPKIYSRQEYFYGLNKLLPIYKLTSGISNNSLRKYMQVALEEVEFGDDYLSAGYRREKNLYSRTKAIKAIHFPDNKEDAVKAKKRIAFDEFYTFLISLARLKTLSEDRRTREKYVDTGICESFIASLSFSLTGAQIKVWNEIRHDMMSGTVMARLVQGDVGSGKTILAMLALLFNYENGFQGAIMAPTEVLARQHYNSFCNMFEKYGVKIALLTGSVTAAGKRKLYTDIASGDIDIVVGTHAIIQDKVEYKKLGLVITDEQHRFGVNQRIMLSKKGDCPHTLVMSATPIPRTLAMIIYGDMDISVVDELPQGRLPIKNCVVGTSYRKASYNLIVDEINSGNQVYIICPMVEEDDESNLESVQGYSVRLREYMPENVRIGVLHGRMTSAEKNAIMKEFSEGMVDILVSTTVIEVGINVPSATVMMVENSERFGLAQLHQLRGRVGRGDRQSYCIFMHGDTGADNIKRLEVLNKSNDGFYIASEDLKLRGPGDMFGVRQSGDLVFRYADIYSDGDMLMEANELVRSLSLDDIENILKEHTYLNNAFDNREEEIGL